MPDLCEDVIFMICDLLLEGSEKRSRAIPRTTKDMLSWKITPNGEDMHLLYNLALINRRWESVCSQLLYRFISVRRKSAKYLDSLLQTCATRPWKAQAVRRLYFRKHRHLSRAACSADIIAAVENSDLSHGLRHRLCEQLRAGNPGAKMAALLCFCSNVEDVQIIDSGYAEDSFVLEVLAESAMKLTSPPQQSSDWLEIFQPRSENPQAHGCCREITNSGSSSRILVLRNLQRTRIAWKQDCGKNRYPRSTYYGHASLSIRGRLFVFPLHCEDVLSVILQVIPTPDELLVFARRCSTSWCWYMVGRILCDSGSHLRVLNLQDHFWANGALSHWVPIRTMLPHLESLTIDRSILFSAYWQSMDLRAELPLSIRILHIYGRQYRFGYCGSWRQDEQLVELARDPRFRRLCDIHFGLDCDWQTRVATYSEQLQDTAWHVENHQNTFVFLTRDVGAP